MRHVGWWRLILLALLAGAVPGAAVSACPFCSAVKPTLAQQRESAAVVALGEVLSVDEGARTFRIHHVATGKSLLTGLTLTIASDLDLKPGGLVVLFASEAAEGGKLDWTAIATTDVAYAYFSKAPTLRVAGDERLAYFIRYLEHGDAQVAEDAYLEFAHAPFDDVANVAARFDAEQLRQWLTDDAVPADRKGLYGLCLGLAPREREENARLLRRLVESPGSDFRAGVDGVIGGFLVSEGESALETLDKLYFDNAEAAVGHVRHAMNALRFYREYGRDIPVERLCQSIRHLLARPEFAAATITDLARWEDWPSQARIAALYGQQEYQDLPTRKAIVQFMMHCPGEAAAEILRAIREQEPRLVEAVEKQSSRQTAGQ